MKKILILHTSVGLGHKSIAENISATLVDAGFVVQLEDILKVEQGRLVSISTALHGFINQSVPWLWAWLYQSEWFTNLTLPYRTWVAGKNYQNTKMVIDGFQPDCIISTQTSASAVVAYLKQKGLYKGQFGIAFSDFHLHKYWLYQEANFYLVNIDEQKQGMVELGIDQRKIFVCGIMLPKKVAVNASEIRQKLRIPPENKIMLLASGSMGLKINENFISYFSKKEGITTIVVCGKNQKTYDNLSKQFLGTNCIILGYYKPMSELYVIADLFITKPGGLSIAEALAWKLPILISHLLPGQEELNYEYLLDNGLVMPEPFALEASAEEELATGSFRADIQKNEALSKISPKPEVLLNCFTGVTSNRF